jgi:predicted amidohydrolase YtcJ
MTHLAEEPSMETTNSRKLTFVRNFLLPALVMTLASSAIAQVRTGIQPADLILHNGIIWTVDSKNSIAEAVAIRDGKFAVVGSNRAALTLRGPRTRVIDLRGRFVTPGFNDNHVHFASAAQFLEFNIMAVSTQEQFIARVKDVISRLPQGEWIAGGFWGAYDQWATASAGGQQREPFAPDLSLVEEFTADYPMFIRKFDDSQFAANRAALRAAGIDPQNPRAPEVEFLKDAQGRFTGHMRGTGVTRLFASIVPRTFSRERRIQQTKNALAEIRRFGVTNVSDMSDDMQLDVYRELHRKGELTVRVHFRPGLDRWKEMSEKGIKVGSGDEWIRLGALKGHIDGIMGTSSARFFQPYSNNPNNRGRWRPLMVNDKGEFVEGKFLGYMLDADRAGLQLTVHAIGDEANSVLLDYLEELDRRNGQRDRRFRLVHAQVLAPKDFSRLGPLRIVAEVQPFHLSDDMRWMEERIGHERSKGAYAFKSIQASGAILSFGTDWPGTSASEYPINPMLGLYAAVKRQTTSGKPDAGWFPDERISIQDAIRAYTYNTAYANYEEKIKGSIEVGKFADLTVLSRNLLRIPQKEILHTDVVYTIVNGKIVYRNARVSR